MLAAECGSEEFLCRYTAVCILKDLICNGHDDCGDNSDELQHCNAAVSSEFLQFFLDQELISYRCTHLVILVLIVRRAVKL